MRDSLLSSLLTFFREVVEKKVNQNGIYFCIFVVVEYLSSDKLNTPYAATTKLDFPAVTSIDELLGSDSIVQRRTV